MCLQIIYIEFIYICIKSVWHYITYNGWYAMKPNQTETLISSNSFKKKLNTNCVCKQTADVKL